MHHLVSGAAGFIGSHLCDRLLAEGHEVVGLDNLITGSKRNIAICSDMPTFHFVECDVTRAVQRRRTVRSRVASGLARQPQGLSGASHRNARVGSTGHAQHARDRAP